MSPTRQAPSKRRGTSAPSRRPRRGRASGSPPNREGILAAAREQFARQGYAGATIRAIAARARVDPALVLHYFGSKEQLFLAAMELAVPPEEFVPQLLEGGVQGLGERLLRHTFAYWEKLSTPDVPMEALLRSAAGHETAARMLREFLTEAVFGPLLEALDVPQPRLRAALVASQLAGIALARRVLRIEPLASADTELLVACYAPTVQRYLTGPLPGDR